MKKLVVVAMTFIFTNLALGQDACETVESLLKKRDYLIDANRLALTIDYVTPKYTSLNNHLKVAKTVTTASAITTFLTSLKARIDKSSKSEIAQLGERFSYMFANSNHSNKENALNLFKQLVDTPEDQLDGRQKAVFDQLVKEKEDAFQAFDKARATYKESLISKTKLSKNYLKGIKPSGIKGVKDLVKRTGNKAGKVISQNRYTLFVVALAAAAYIASNKVQKMVLKEHEKLSFKENIISVLSAHTFDEKIQICDNIAVDASYRKEINMIDNILHQLLIALEEGSTNELEIAMEQIDSSLTRDNLKYHPKTKTEESYYELYIKKAVNQE